MKRRVPMLVVLLTMSVMTGGSAQSICGFEVDETLVVDSTVSGFYRYLDRASQPGVEENSGWISITYDRIFDSPSFGYSIAAGSQVLIDRWVATSWVGDASAAYRYYVSQALPLYAYGRAIGQTDVSHPLPGVELRSGVGFGRFHDVTAMAKAHRIVRALIENGALSSTLPDRATEDVARILADTAPGITNADRVAAVVDRIELATESDLDVGAALLVEHEVARTRDDRYCGWLIQGGVGYELVDAYGASRDTLYTVSTDFARAVSPDTQLRVQSGLSTPTTLLAEYEFTLSLSLEATLSGARSVQVSYDMTREHSPVSEALVTRRATIDYLIETGKARWGISFGLSRMSSIPQPTIDVGLLVSLNLF